MGVAFYLITVPKVKAINKDDVRALEEAFGELPYIGRIIGKVLKLEGMLL